MSTTTKTTRGKPVTLAKSASGEPVPTKAISSKPVAPKAKAAKSPIENAEQRGLAAPILHDAADPAFAEKWNDLVKAQSEAALAWWQDAKDARTLADAIAVNARHSRVQFELATGQAREMAAYFQKTFEGNAERLRALLAPNLH